MCCQHQELLLEPDTLRVRKGNWPQRSYRVHQEFTQKLEVDQNMPHSVEFPTPVNLQNCIDQIPTSLEQSVLLFLKNVILHPDSGARG